MISLTFTGSGFLYCNPHGWGSNWWTWGWVDTSTPAKTWTPSKPFSTTAHTEIGTRTLAIIPRVCFCFLQVHPAPDERQHEQAAVQLVPHEPGQEAQVGGLGNQGDPPEEQPGGQGQEKRGAKGKRKQPTIITKLCCFGKRTSSRRTRIKKTSEEQYWRYPARSSSCLCREEEEGEKPRKTRIAFAFNTHIAKRVEPERTY